MLHNRTSQRTRKKSTGRYKGGLTPAATMAGLAGLGAAGAGAYGLAQFLKKKQGSKPITIDQMKAIEGSKPITIDQMVGEDIPTSYDPRFVHVLQRVLPGRTFFSSLYKTPIKVLDVFAPIHSWRVAEITYSVDNGEHHGPHGHELAFFLNVIVPEQKNRILKEVNEYAVTKDIANNKLPIGRGDMGPLISSFLQTRISRKKSRTRKKSWKIRKKSRKTRSRKRNKM